MGEQDCRSVTTESRPRGPITPTWVVPFGNGSQATITIDADLSPPAVLLTMPESTSPLSGDASVLTPLSSTQLGMALADAGRVAGQLAAKRSAARRNARAKAR